MQYLVSVHGDRIASRSRNSRISLHNRSGCIGLWSEFRRAALCSAYGGPPPHGDSTIQSDSSRPAQSASRLSASASSWPMTALASPTIPRSMLRLWPSSASIDVDLHDLRVAIEPVTVLHHPVHPGANDENEVSLAHRGASRAAWNETTWSSGTTPRDIGAV